MKNSFFVSLFFAFNVQGYFSQTELITNGGFENATSTFAANGWTQVGTQSSNAWFIGTAAGSNGTGTKSAYLGTSSTAFGSGVNFQKNHFYIDVTIPAYAMNVTLSFYYKMPVSDGAYDQLLVYTSTSSDNPTAGTVPPTGGTWTQQSCTVGGTAVSSWTQTTCDLSSLAGNNVRLNFCWKTDDASPYAYVAVDDISLTYIPMKIYKTVQTGNWNSTSTWNSSTDGGTTWSAAAATPTSADGTITIQNNHTVTVSSSVSVDQVTVDAGGTLTVNSGQTLTVANGSGTDLTVNGSLTNAGTVTTTGTVAIAGTYNHTRDGGVVPTATWSSGSTCNVTGITSTAPSGMGQSFHHVTWNCTSQAIDFNLNASPTWAGNFTISSTGSTKSFAVSSGAGSHTLTVSGNVSLTGGTLILSNGANSGGGSLSVSGNMTLTNSAKFYSQAANWGGTLTVSGDLTTSGTATFMGADVNYNSNSTWNLYGKVDLSTGTVGARSGTTNSGYTTLNLFGTNDTLKLPTTSRVYNDNAYWDIKVKNNAVITLQSDIYSGRTVTVETGGTLVLGTYIVQNMTSNAFTTQSGSTIKIANTGGIVTVATGNTGSVQTTTRTFDNGGIYEYNGTSAQNTGTGLPTTISGQLKINNSAGVTLTQATTITGTLDLTSGLLVSSGSNIIYIGNGGTSTNYSSSSYVNGIVKYYLTNAANHFFPVGDATNYRPFEMNSVSCTSGAIVQVSTSNTGASTVNSSMASIAARNWFMDYQSGVLTSATIKITESSLTSTNVIGKSSAQSGTYSSAGGSSIGTSITSNGAVTLSSADAYFAIGTGCTQPTTQASSVLVSNLGATSLTLDWTRGNGSGVAVFMKATSTSTTDPTDGTSYTANTAFSSGNQIGSSGWYCVYAGSGTTVNVTGLTHNTAYFIKAYEYSSTTCYNSDETNSSASTTTYCTPTGQTTYYIANVTTTNASSNINKSTSSPSSYNDYYATNSMTVTTTTSFNFTLTGNGSATFYWYVWVDWNNDGDFSDADEDIYSNTSYANSRSGSYTVSQSAGTYRMRVGAGYNGACTPCSGSTSNFQDYKLIVAACTTTASAGSNVAMCLNSGSVSVVTGASGTNYTSSSWGSSGTGSFSATNTISSSTYTPSAADLLAGSVTLTLTATGSSGCSATSTKTLTINALPKALLTGTQSICSGYSADLTFTSVAGTGPFSLIYKPSGGSNTTVNSLSSGGTVTVSPSTSTTYEIISVTDANGCVWDGNLVVNPSGLLGTNSWTYDVNGGSGWAVTSDPAFVTSYAACAKSQTISLTGLGYSTTELNAKPDIYFEDSYASLNGNKAGGASANQDKYGCRVELRNSSNTSLSAYASPSTNTSFNISNFNTVTNYHPTYATVSNTFSGYSTGLTNVKIQDGGQDAEYWSGNYGSYIKGTTLKVLPKITVTTSPTIATTTDGSRCGTGTVSLGATASAGTVNWYTVSSGGSSFTTGTTYTTGSISATTTYYVDATSSGCTTATRTAVTATVNTVPTTQTTNFVFSSVDEKTMTVSWTRGNGGSVLIVAKAGSASTDPTDGTSYTGNAAYGSGTACGGGYAIYAGTGTSVNLTGLTGNTTYHFAAYEYSSSGVCYNATQLTGSQATLDQETWLGGTSTNWATAANWSSAYVPTSTTNVTIPSGTTFSPAIESSTAANTKNLTINSSATLTIGNTNAGGGTFSIYGDLLNNGNINHTSDLNTNLRGTNNTFGGSGEFSYLNEFVSFSIYANCTYTLSTNITMINQLRLNTGSVLNLSSYTLSIYTFSFDDGTVNLNTGTLEIGNAIDYTAGTLNVNTGMVSFNRGATVWSNHGYSSAGGNQTINSFNYYDLKVRTNNGYTATIGTTGTVAVSNNLTIENPSTAGGTATLAADVTVGGDFNLGNTGNALTLNMPYRIYRASGTGTLTMGNVSGHAVSVTYADATNFAISGFGTPTFYGTVTYNSGSAQKVITAAGYNNLTCSGAGTKSLFGNLDVNNNLTISAGTLDVTTSNYTINIGGTFSNSATFTSRSGTVTFDGSSAQTISGTSDANFNSVTLNNSAGISLGLNSTIKNTLTFSSGKLTTQGYTLTLGTSTSDAVVSGAGATKYIVAYNNSGTIGKVKQFVNYASSTNYSFPVGDATYYTPLTYTQVSGTVGSGAYLEVYTQASKVSGMNAALNTYINRNWDVTSSGMTNPNYTIAYTYDNADIVGTETDLYPVKKSGTTWYKPTGSTFTTGTTEGSGSVTASTNTLTWSGLTTFSSFGGAGNSAVPLPVELMSFNANCKDNRVDINWFTATEHNTSHFRLDRSRDGQQWEVISTIGAAGNSTNLLEYAITDFNPIGGTNYYRLAQYDLDGVYEMYGPISASCVSEELGIQVYPNPTKGKFYVKLNIPELVGSADLIVMDSKGAYVYRQTVNVQQDANTFVVEDLDLTPGMYFVKIAGANNTSEVVKITVR